MNCIFFLLGENNTSLRGDEKIWTKLTHFLELGILQSTRGKILISHRCENTPIAGIIGEYHRTGKAISLIYKSSPKALRSWDNACRFMRSTQLAKQNLADLITGNLL